MYGDRFSSPLFEELSKRKTQDLIYEDKEKAREKQKELAEEKKQLKEVERIDAELQKRTTALQKLEKDLSVIKRKREQLENEGGSIIMNQSEIDSSKAREDSRKETLLKIEKKSRTCENKTKQREVLKNSLKKVCMNAK